MTDFFPSTRQQQPESPGPQDVTGESGAPSSQPQPLEKEIEARSQQRALLVEVSSALAGATDLEGALGQVLLRLRERALVARGSIYGLNSESRLLRCVAESGFSGANANRTWSLDGPGLVAWAARTGEALYVPYVAKEARSLREDSRSKSQYVVPLLRRSTVLGVLDIQSDAADGIRAVTRKLVDQIAGQIALTLERNELYKKLNAAEERFRSVREQNYLGVVLSDLEGALAIVNPTSSVVNLKNSGASTTPR